MASFPTADIRAIKMYIIRRKGIKLEAMMTQKVFGNAKIAKSVICTVRATVDCGAEMSHMISPTQMSV